MTDPYALGERFRAGDNEAFRDLFSEHSDRVYRFFLVKTRGNVHESEDLTQEAFTRAWTGRRSFNSERDFRAWLFGIAHNAWVDMVRKARFNIPLDEAPEIPDGNPSLEDDTHEKILVEKVLNKLEEFPKASREVILLTYIAELSSGEISEILNKKPSAIRMIRLRTLAKLKKILGVNPALETEI